jgi:hypothetical protein
MSGICKDCKWWESFEAWWEEYGQYRYDSPDDIRYEWGVRRYGECKLAESDGQNPDHEQTKAFATDGEHYQGGLQTAPDFGCNQWEEVALDRSNPTE